MFWFLMLLGACVCPQVPSLCEDLLSSVDQPLKIAKDTAVGKDYLLCDYNRDGDSYRWTMGLQLQQRTGSTRQYRPGIITNTLIAQYRSDSGIKLNQLQMTVVGEYTVNVKYNNKTRRPDGHWAVELGNKQTRE